MRVSRLRLTILPFNGVILQDVFHNPEITSSRRECPALRVLALLFVGLLISFSALGQSSTGITGRIVDTSGAVVVGAKVTVVNTGTGVRRVFSSDNDGYYTDPALIPGAYQVAVSESGFKSAVQSDLKLDQGQELEVDFTLVPGQVTESVQVSSAAPLLETQTSQMNVVVPSQRITDMPTVGHNPLEFALLVPGVRASGSDGQIPVSAFSGGKAAIAGGPVSANNYMVDGIVDESNTSGNMQNPLSVDATAEFLLIAHNAPAEYGRTGGGVMNLISKSGTNQFHGDLYEFNQNTILEANNYFSKGAGVARQPYHFNLWGATIGGPIAKDKTFFFFDYEQWVQSTLATTIGTVPTDLQRQGDFSQTFTSSGDLVKIYDPYTSQPDPNNPGNEIRTQFMNNTIPAGRISSIAKALAAYYPEPNTAGVPLTNANNFFGIASEPINSTTLGLRLDQYLTPTRRLAGRYTSQREVWGYPNFYHNIAEPLNSTTPFNRGGGFVSYSDAIRPALFMDLRGGLNLYWVDRNTRSYGYQVSTLGFPASLDGEIQVPMFPTVTISDDANLGMNSTDELFQSSKDFAYDGSLMWIRGRNTWQFGSQNSIRQFNNTQNNMNLSLAFNRGFTQGSNPNTSGAASGYSYASFLLGTPASGTIGYGAGTTETLKAEALYAQDDWKLRPNFTANVGLRWEYEGGITDRFNAISNFDPNVITDVNNLTLTGGLAFPGVGGLSRGDRDASWTHFQPRVGFAWQVIPKTVIHAAYGLFFLPTTGNNGGNGLDSSGFSTSLALVSSLDGFTPDATLANPFPTPLAPPTGSSQGALTLLGQSIKGNLRDLRQGSSQQWSFLIQRELPGSWLLEIGYMGNRGEHLPVYGTFDYLPNGYRSLGTQLQQQVANPFYGTISPTLALGKPTVAQNVLLDTYPQFSGVTGFASMADSTYHAGTLRVERRFTDGFGLLLSFTDSKLIDDNSGNGENNFNDSGSEAVRDWGNISLERSVSTENMPRTFVASGSYELPFGKTGSALLRQIVGGWQLNGIGTIDTGESIGVLQNPSTLGSSNPNLVGNPTMSHPKVSAWLNKAAFVDSSAFTLGDAPRNLPRTRTDAWKGLDLSLMKSLSFGDLFKLQTRAEAFNFTNTPIFGNPNTNIDSAGFGTVTSLATNNNPRSVQIALKLLF